MICKLQTTAVCCFPNTTVLVSNMNWNLLYKNSQDNQVQVLPGHHSLSYNLVSFQWHCKHFVALLRLTKLNCCRFFFKIHFIIINSLLWQTLFIFGIKITEHAQPWGYFLKIWATTAVLQMKKILFLKPQPSFILRKAVRDETSTPTSEGTKWFRSRQERPSLKMCLLDLMLWVALLCQKSYVITSPLASLSCNVLLW